MLQHPHYLEIPWDAHRKQVTTGLHRHLWWLIATLILLAVFLSGISVTNGLA